MSDFRRLSRDSVLNILDFHTFPSFSNIDSSIVDTVRITRILETCFGSFSKEKDRKIYLLNKSIHILISPSIGHKTVLRKCWIPWEVVWKITYEDGQFSAESDRTVSNLLMKKVFPKCRNLHQLGWNCSRILKDELLSKIVKRGENVKFPNFNENLRIIHWPQSEKVSMALNSFPKLENVLLYQINREDDRFGKAIGKHKEIKQLAIVKCNEKQFRYCRKNSSLEDIYVGQIFNEETTRFVLWTHRTIQKISTPIENLKISKTDLLGQNYVLKELYLWGSEEDSEHGKKDVISILSRSHVKKLTLVDCRLVGEDLSLLFSSTDGGIGESLEEFEINDESVKVSGDDNLSLKALRKAENLRVLQISAITNTENILEYLSTEPSSLIELSFTMGVEWKKIREAVATKCQGLRRLRGKRNVLDDESFLYLVDNIPSLEKLNFKPSGSMRVVEWARRTHGEDNPSFLERVKKKFSSQQSSKKNTNTNTKKKKSRPSHQVDKLLASLHVTGMVIKKAERAYKKKKFLKSYELVDQLIKGDQGNSLFLDLFLHRAKSSWKLGKYNRCLFDASHVLDKDPGHKDAFKFAVESSLKLKRYREIVVLMRDSFMNPQQQEQTQKGGIWTYLDELVNRDLKKNGMEHLIKCGNCGKFSYSLLQCVRCKKTCYCDRDCQVKHFPKHKEGCTKK